MKEYLSETAARAAIVEIGKRIYSKGYVAANDGNISCRLRDGTILVTPTGVSKGYMTDDMIVKTDLNGQPQGNRAPSSEVKMHLRAYRENPDIKGIIHAHPPVSTSFSIAGLEMKHPLVAEAVLVTGNILIAPYAKPGTFDVPDSIAPYVTKYHGVLLENHGALTWGQDLEQALYRLEAMEHQASITLYSSLLSFLFQKKLHRFTPEQLQGLVEIRTSMGITTGGTPEP